MTVLFGRIKSKEYQIVGTGESCVNTGVFESGLLPEGRVLRMF